MEQARAVIEECLAQGVTFLDSARGYDKAEDALGLTLGARREKATITTKARGNTGAQAQRNFDDSLRRLKTDYVDILYWHEASGRDAQQAVGPDGVLTWLSKQKAAGKARFIGITGHMRAKTMVPLLESGVPEVCMVPLNFVDHHQYHFEEIVLPVVRRLRIGLVAMKVFGGERGSNWARYGGPNPGPQADEAQLGRCLRYALGLDGVACAVVGMHTVEQVRVNVALARAHQPLSAEELAQLDKLGQELVAAWGPRLGPVE
jgi:aryl-alcohol dehydrogenase-like predicted oxidoreductase